MYVFITDIDWDSGEDPVRAVARAQSVAELQGQPGFDLTTTWHYRRSRLTHGEAFSMQYLRSGQIFPGSIYSVQS